MDHRARTRTAMELQMSWILKAKDMMPLNRGRAARKEAVAHRGDLNHRDIRSRDLDLHRRINLNWDAYGMALVVMMTIVIPWRWKTDVRNCLMTRANAKAMSDLTTDAYGPTDPNRSRVSMS